MALRSHRAPRLARLHPPSAWPQEVLSLTVGGSVTDIRWSPDYSTGATTAEAAAAAQLLVCVGEDGLLVEAASGRVAACLRAGGGNICCSAWGGGRIALGTRQQEVGGSSGGGKLVIFDPSTGARERELEVPVDCRVSWPVCCEVPPQPDGEAPLVALSAHVRFLREADLSPAAAAVVTAEATPLLQMIGASAEG